MELKKWLSSRTHDDNDSVLFFTGSFYSPLFFSLLINDHNQRVASSCVVVDPQMDRSLLQAQLQSSFLGQTQWYYFRSLDDDYSPTDKMAWLTFFSTYQGPHSLICFSTRIVDPAKHWKVVAIPEVIDYQTALQLASLLHGGGAMTPFIDKLFVYSSSMSVDQFLLLMRYGMLVGKNTDQFFMDWLPQLMVSNSSLFALSQAFFSKQPRQFLRQWVKLSSLYPAQFWITYWSEQIWRATCYVKLQRQGKEDEAKKIAYRLPFSFINRDWRQYNAAELARAHDHLYEIDFRLKNGSDEAALDYFVGAFVHHRYKGSEKA